MLKILAIIVLMLLVFRVQAYPETHKTQGTSQSNEPTPPAAPAVGPKQNGSAAIKSKGDDHIEANVRVISAPAKDRYDKAAFWISVALAGVGITGIGVALCTLRAIGRQADLMEGQTSVMAAQAGHMEAQTEILKKSVSAAEKSADAAQSTVDAMISKERARIRIEVDGLYTWHEMASVHYRVYLYGSTPAYISDTSAMAIVTESPAFPDALSLFSVNIPDVLTEAKSECKVYVSNRTEFTAEDYALLDTGKLFVHFYGIVKYRDFYDKDRGTAFCYVYKTTDLKNPGDGSIFKTWVKNGGSQRNWET